MNEDAAPPTPLPPASQPPYPAHPPAHAHHDAPETKSEQPAPTRPVERAGPSLGQIALVGGGIAVALGIAWSFTRKPAHKPKAPKKAQSRKKPSGKKKS